MGGKDGWTKEPLPNPPVQAVDPRLANVPETVRCCVTAVELARRAEQQGYIASEDLGGKHFHYRVVESGNAQWPLAFCVPPKKQMVQVVTKRRGMSLTEFDPDLDCQHTPGGIYYTCLYQKKNSYPAYLAEACFYIK